MIGPRIGEAGEAELADAAESLDLGGVEKAEEESFERAVRAKDNDVVDGIADDFLGHAAISKWPGLQTRYRLWP